MEPVHRNGVAIELSHLVCVTVHLDYGLPSASPSEPKIFRGQKV